MPFGHGWARLADMRVRDVMNTDVAVTTPAATLGDVLELLTTRGVSGLPVVDADGHVLGVVSQADILATTASRPGTSAIADLLLEGTKSDPEVTARTAGEVMSSPAHVIEETGPITQAAAQMLDHGIKRLPVVRAGKLVGIVTRSDLLRAFTRPDEEIAREIRDDVLARLLGHSPREVAVHVEAGMVALCGQVETRSEAEVIEGLVRRVPGVVSVQTSITWRIDDRASLVS
jgi:CBS domain-containing protein